MLAEIFEFLGENYALLLIGMVSAAVLLALLYGRKAIKTAAFAYAVTRARVMAGGMLKKEKLSGLAESSSAEEVIAGLEGSAYEMHASGKKSLEEIEKSLAKSLAMDYAKIRGITPGKSKKFFELISARYDVANAKNLLSAKQAGEQPSPLLPGTFSDAFLQRMQDTANTEEMLGLLKETVYGKAIEELPSGASAMDASRLLEKNLHEKMLNPKIIESTAKKEGIENDAFFLKKIFGIQKDIRNIKIAMRLAKAGIAEKKGSHFISGQGAFIGQEMLPVLGEAQDMQSLVNALQGTPYYEKLSEAMRSKTADLYVFENALDEYYTGQVRSIYQKQAFGLTPLACYLLLKEHEIISISCILNGLREGLSKEKIKEIFIGA